MSMRIRRDGTGFSLFMVLLIGALAVYAAGPGRAFLLFAISVGLLYAVARLWLRSR